MGFLRLCLLVMFMTITCASVARAEKNRMGDPLVYPNYSPFWPQPEDYSYETQYDYPLALSTDFEFFSKTSFDSDVLDRAMDRYTQLLKPSADKGEDGEISSCLITVSGTEKESSRSSFILGVDESYSLQVTNETCQIQAVTVWGGINGMETFTQIFQKLVDGTVSSVYLYNVNVNDYNRFQHRGILIDTSRHYLSIDEITRMVDAAKMSKYNVLHVHLVDAQSFPFNSDSSPEIVKGAYSPSLQYTRDDIKYISDYAYDRGIRILYEIDVPGHAFSWGKGYPEVLADCVSKYSNVNNIALNPTLNKTYDVLYGILKDLIKYSGNSPYIHIGGDEVVYGCWDNDDSIKAFMSQNGISDYDGLLEYFVQIAEQQVLSLDAQPIHWEEVFLAGANVAPETIFQVWQSQELIQTIVEANYPVIASPAVPWYLDTWQGSRPVPNTWEDMYNYDPSINMTAQQEKLLLGGEVAMWGEYVDDANIESYIFPRAMAVGERLWSNRNQTDIDDAADRLSLHRCRMVARGFRSGPIRPDYCESMPV